MDRELTCINAIPLVDVMLVLLVIVLTAVTYVTTGQVPCVVLISASRLFVRARVCTDES